MKRVLWLMILLMVAVSVPAQTKKKPKSAKQLSKQYVDYVRNKNKGKKNIAQKGASDPATVTRQLLGDKGYTKSDSILIQKAFATTDSLRKEGWMASSKTDSLVLQFVKSYVLKSRYIEKETKSPKYTFGESIAQGKDYKEAKKAALKQALNNLSSNVYSEIVSYTEKNDTTSSGAPYETINVVQDISYGKLVVIQNIDKVIKAIDMYRTLPDSKVEVFLQIAIDADFADNELQKIMVNELK